MTRRYFVQQSSLGEALIIDAQESVGYAVAIAQVYHPDVAKHIADLLNERPFIPPSDESQ